jgi:RNA polymerase sigma factor (sigma-70 family)
MRVMRCGCDGALRACDGRSIAASLERPDAFEAVFERHFDIVWRYACRRAGAQVADDVASQTFVVAFDKRRRFRDGVCDARPWLLGIATNLLRRHRRSELARLRAQAAAPVERDPGIEGAIERADAAEFAPLAAEALAAMSRRDREILALLAWADLTYEEIAEALNVPVGTVRSRAHRARARIRELLDAAGATPDEGELIAARAT